MVVDRPSKKNIKRLRSERRAASRTRTDSHVGNVVAEVDDGSYWEMETVIGRRIKRGRVEYLIRWKGCGDEDNTWEPASNLCDTAMEEAMKFSKAQKMKDKQREDDEKRLFEGGDNQNQENTCDEEIKVYEIDASSESDIEIMPQDCKAQFSEEKTIQDCSLDDLWDWTDRDQVVFRPVQRININDPTAESFVREARINGTPIVLVGHVGWANFAKRWLSTKKNGGGSGTIFDSVEMKGERESGSDRNGHNHGKRDSGKDAKAAGLAVDSIGANGSRDSYMDSSLPRTNDSPLKSPIDAALPILSNENGDLLKASKTNGHAPKFIPSNGENIRHSTGSQSNTRSFLPRLNDGFPENPISVKGNESSQCNGELFSAKKLNGQAPEYSQPTGEKTRHSTELDSCNYPNSCIPRLKDAPEKPINVDSHQSSSHSGDILGATKTNGYSAEYFKSIGEEIRGSTGSDVVASHGLEKTARSLVCVIEDSVFSDTKEVKAVRTLNSIVGNVTEAIAKSTDATRPLSYELEVASHNPSLQLSSSESHDRMGCPWLDLSKLDFFLDIEKMINDIGDEDVPVIKRNYNEEKPIHGKIQAAKFLTNCWPSTERVTEASKQKKSPNLYLHQWQFPLSDTAGHKLCHNNNPLPKTIMGEDLLKYWLDLPQCKLDSPLQYIFMGREDTLSKLHNDPGGLDITIAPIVGEKECVLVHRSDGSTCLYHLAASLDDIDLHRYPLLSQARIWRTTIQPGEILLMPHGTYHQCRNVTSCLSYSRFHLDTLNLSPFMQSLANEDAPEIDHEEILWNCTSELIAKIDSEVDATQSLVKKNLFATKDLPDNLVDTVNLLRTFRHFVREVARRHEIRKTLKGEGGIFKKGDFSTLVDDVDMCLHEFRYRRMKIIPQFKVRRGKALKNTIGAARKNTIKTDLSKFEVGGIPAVAFNTVLEVNYMSMTGADIDKLYPCASDENTGEKMIGSLAPGDLVMVKLVRKVVRAEVLEVVHRMSSVYLSFEDYPSLYDEWQPSNLVRLPTREEIPPGDIKPGLVVIDLSNTNEYRAVVTSTKTGPMAKMRLTVSQHVMTRWISPDMILGKYAPKTQNQNGRGKKRSSMIVVDGEPDPPTCRPKTGQVVVVRCKGAAWVTKCYYENDNKDPIYGPSEPCPTHVDVRYILGTSIEEKLVPINLVRLAPEMDPDCETSERKRRVAKKMNV